MTPQELEQVVERAVERALIRHEQKRVERDGLTVLEAAEVLGVSPRTVKRRIKDGELKAQLRDGYHRIKRSDIERYMRHEPTTADSPIGADEEVLEMLNGGR